VLARKLAQEALDRIAEGGDPAAEKQAAKRTALHDGRDRIDQVIADSSKNMQKGTRGSRRTRKPNGFSNARSAHAGKTGVFKTSPVET